MHARDKAHGVCIDMETLGIDQAVVDMEMMDPPKKYGRASDVDLLEQPAFHSDGRRGDARRRDIHRRACRDSAMLDFVEIGRTIDAGEIHRRRVGLGDEVDNELAAIENIPRRILEAPVGAANDAEDDERRIRAHHVEEAERRCVGVPVRR